MLQSLSSFLRHALSTPSQPADKGQSPLPTWYLESSFTSRASFQAFDAMFYPSRTDDMIWKIEADDGDEEFIHDYPLAVVIPQLSLLEVLESATNEIDLGTSSNNSLHFILVSRLTSGLTILLMLLRSSQIRCTQPSSRPFLTLLRPSFHQARLLLRRT